MPDFGIRLLIEAEDRATQIVGRLYPEFERTRRGAEDVTRSFSQTGRQVRLLAGELSSELNPALGNIVTRATQAGGAVGGMGGGMAVATAAAVAAAAALAQYVRTLNETVERQAALNIAVRSFDAGAIRSSLSAASLELEKMQLRGQTAIGGMINMLTKFAASLGLTVDQTKLLSEAQAALQRVLPLEREAAMADVYGKQQQALQGLLAVEIQRAGRVNDLDRFIALHERLLQLLSNEAAAEERLLETQRKAAVGAAQARGEPQAAIDIINDRFKGLKSALGERTLAQVEGVREAERIGAFDIRGRLIPPAPAQEFPHAEGGIPFEREGRETVRQGRLETLQLELQRASILREISGLTQSERAAIEVGVVEAERRVKIEEARGHLGKEALANLEAQVRTAAVLQQEMERVDLGAGLAAGFRDVAEIVESAGARMRDNVLSAFQDINRGFVDIVVAGITGQSSKIGDIGRRMGESLLRGLVEQFTTRATGSLSQSIGGLLPTRSSVAATVGAAAIAGSVVAPAGVGAGTLVPVGAGVGRVTATGTVQPVASTAGSMAYGQGGDAAMAGGGGGFGGVPLTGVGSLLPSGTGGGGFVSGFFGPSVSLYEAAIAYQAGGLSAVAAVQAGNAVVVGGEVVYTAGAAYGGGAAAVGALEGGGAASAGATTASSAAGAGAAAASVIGGVFAAAALAYGAYTAYQAGAAGDKYAAASGALSGAVSGAVLGTIIYPGIGTAVGLVAGAAIGAGAGAAGKAEHGESHAHREAKETRDVVNAVSGFQGAVLRSASFEEVYDALIAFSHANYGGNKASTAPEHAGFQFTFDWLDDRYLVGTRDPSPNRRKLADKAIFRAWALAGDLMSFRARIQAGIAGVEQINGPAEQAVRQKLDELRRQELAAIVAYQEGFDAPGVAGTAVTRLTVLPYSRRAEAEGQQLLVSRDQFALAGLTDDELELLLRRLAKVDRDRNLGAIDAEHLIF